MNLNISGIREPRPHPRPSTCDGHAPVCRPYVYQWPYARKLRLVAAGVARVPGIDVDLPGVPLWHLAHR